MEEILSRKARFWQIVFYLSLSVLTIWLILKVTGYIQTPLWLEYGIPIASLIIGVLALHHNIYTALKDLAVGQVAMMGKINNLGEKVDHVEGKVDHLEGRVNYMEKDIGKIKEKLSIA